MGKGQRSTVAQHEVVLWSVGSSVSLTQYYLKSQFPTLTTPREHFMGPRCQGEGERQDGEIRSPQSIMIVCKHQLLYNSAHGCLESCS